jgi:hypothetical protein
VCAFLGLDYAAWVRGFADLDAIFAWVTASPYFSVVPYLDDEPKKLRPTILAFIAWLRARGASQRPAFEAKETYLPQVVAAFPEADLPAQLAAEAEREARAIALRAKWSGKLVMQLRPELGGSALGEFIQAFRNAKGGPEAFEAWVLAATDDEIAAQIRAFVAI